MQSSHAKSELFTNLENGVTIVENALETFMRDKRIHLTDQQHARMKKLLMVCVLKDDFSDDGITFATVYNFLGDLFEYRKDYDINANAHDEAQEEIVHIIAAADNKEVQVFVETSRYRKRFIVLALGAALFLVGAVAYQGLAYLQHRTVVLVEADELRRVISASEEAKIRSLVWAIVEAEQKAGRSLSHSAVYNRLKNAEAIRSYGDASSYKKFNHAQYIEALRLLEQWLAEIEKTPRQ